MPQAWPRWNANCRNWERSYVVAPAAEQSGVAHSITFLSPLICKEIFEGQRAAEDGPWKGARPTASSWGVSSSVPDVPIWSSAASMEV
jgi:broad specificity polyphosphatase/5'/3'-nucleotidase SurE